MSRLYLSLQRDLEAKVISGESIENILKDFIASQKGLSARAHIKVECDLPVKRPALVSEERGWRQYPVQIIGELGPEGFLFELQVTIAYSSTCPCSAALARQLVSEKFAEDFASEKAIEKEQVLNWLKEASSMVATPHAQRSHAHVKVRLEDPKKNFALIDVIDEVEESLATPVQAAVKRQDEQEFARRNGQNLMFCEDAARRVKKGLDADGRFVDYWIRVEHFESLHPHNAVSVLTKGIAGGYQP